MKDTFPVTTAMLALAVLAQACTATSADSGLGEPWSREIPPIPDGPNHTLRGYVLRRGQTIVLFPDQRSLGEYDYEVCLNIGSEDEVFRQLSRLEYERVRIRAVSMGEVFATFPEDVFAINRIRGRAIEQWCDDGSLYWALDVDRIATPPDRR